MDIQAAKLNLVQRILKVNTEGLINQLNDLLDKENIVAYAPDGTPLSEIEYNKSLELAEEDSRYNRVTNSSDLRKEIGNWKK